MESQRISTHHLLFSCRGICRSQLQPLGMVNAMAQSATGLQGLVCLFLFGGNDSNNMVIPFDTAGYGAYKTAREA